MMSCRAKRKLPDLRSHDKVIGRLPPQRKEGRLLTRISHQAPPPKFLKNNRPYSQGMTKELEAPSIIVIKS